MPHIYKKKNSCVFAVISGKGGVGKSLSTVNLASMLNDMGYKVAIIDVDLGLANCATLFNQSVKTTLCQWIANDCSLEDTFQNIGGITLVTAANDPIEVKIGNELIMDGLDQLIDYLQPTHDFIFIDTPAGAREMTIWALDVAECGLVVLVDEPSAISDTYRLCKYVLHIDPDYDFGGLVNFAENEQDAQSTIERFNTILTHFLNRKCNYMGFIPHHPQVKEAVKKQHTLLGIEPNNPINNEIEFLAQNIMSKSKLIGHHNLEYIN